MARTKQVAVRYFYTARTLQATNKVVSGPPQKKQKKSEVTQIYDDVDIVAYGCENTVHLSEFLHKMLAKERSKFSIEPRKHVDTLGQGSLFAKELIYCGDDRVEIETHQFNSTSFSPDSIAYLDKILSSCQKIVWIPQEDKLQYYWCSTPVDESRKGEDLVWSVTTRRWCGVRNEKLQVSHDTFNYVISMQIGDMCMVIEGLIVEHSYTTTKIFTFFHDFIDQWSDVAPIAPATFTPDQIVDYIGRLVTSLK
jgi:hypothetical protein